MNAQKTTDARMLAFLADHPGATAYKVAVHLAGGAAAEQTRLRLAQLERNRKVRSVTDQFGPRWYLTGPVR